MLPEQHSKKNETVIVEIPKNRLRQPFPLVWGLAALALFLVFAIVTLVQFNRINNDKLADQAMKSYETDIRAYETAVKANIDCLTTIEVRETYRTIFAGIEGMFQQTADLPAKLFPDGEIAKAYQESLSQDIDRYITRPVETGLPPKKAADCPQIPEEKPERPDT